MAKEPQPRRFAAPAHGIDHAAIPNILFFTEMQPSSFTTLGSLSGTVRMASYDAENLLRTHGKQWGSGSDTFHYIERRSRPNSTDFYASVTNERVLIQSKDYRVRLPNSRRTLIPEDPQSALRSDYRRIHLHAEPSVELVRDLDPFELGLILGAQDYRRRPTAKYYPTLFEYPHPQDVSGYARTAQTALTDLVAVIAESNAPNTLAG